MVSAASLAARLNISELWGFLRLKKFRPPSDSVTDKERPIKGRRP
jgi:hypothetical protein